MTTPAAEIIVCVDVCVSQGGEEEEEEGSDGGGRRTGMGAGGI